MKNFKLPIKFSDLKIKNKMNIKRLIKNLNNDKKRTVNGIRFIVSKKKGSGEIIYEKNIHLIKKSFMAIMA